MKTCFSFEVSVKGWDFSRTINAFTAGQAKAEYFRDLRDPWPDIPYTALRVKKIGPAFTSPQFAANAAYRGMPEVKCGQRVLVGSDRGCIVGHNSSANFDVLFDADAPNYPGLRLNVHPGSIELIDS